MTKAQKPATPTAETLYPPGTCSFAIDSWDDNGGHIAAFSAFTINSP